MNILILNWRDVSHPKAGGAEVVTMEHARRWILSGHSVTWFTSWYSGAARNEVIDGVRIIRTAGSQTVYLAAPWFLLFNAARFDVIVDEIHGIPFFSPLFTKKPVVVLIHEVAGEIWDYMYRFPLNLIGKTLEKFYFYLYRKNLFWTDAPSTVDELVKKGIQRRSCRVISCPISVPEEVRREQKRIMNITKERNPTFIFVSRVVRMKGIEEVIKAFSFIIREEPEANLWIVGGGEETYIEVLRKMIRDYGIDKNVRFWGKVTDAHKFELMRKSHLLLHASVKEGWGLVVLEAAYVGTPSVVYNVSGLRDIVKDNVTGIVVQNNSPMEMAKMSLMLLRDKGRYAGMQRNAFARVSGLSWDDAARDSLTVLRDAIKHNQ